MKIEMGESLGASWLKHVRKCVLVQTNWKASPCVEFKHQQEIEELFRNAQAVFTARGIDVFRKNNTIDQLVGQTECDVIGVALDDQKINWEALEVAFHEQGLNYGTKMETAAKVAAKMFRIALCLYAYMDTKSAVVSFASPKVYPATEEPVREAVKIVKEFFFKNGFDFKFNLILNHEFYKDIMGPVILSGEQVADTNELFLRTTQLMNVFDAVKVCVANAEGIGLVKSDAENSVEKIGEKIGEYVRRVLPPVLATLNQEEINELCDPQFCKFTFDLNFALLSKKREPIQGHMRYYATPLTLLNTKFYMTNDWYTKNRGKLDAWIASHTTDETNI